MPACEPQLAIEKAKVGSRAGSASAANRKRTNEGISVHQKLPDNNLGRRLVEVHQACEG